MERITDVDKFAGKTIDRAVFVSWRDRLVLVFTDGTNAVVAIDRGYGDSSPDLELTGEDLGSRERVEAGLITNAEYEAEQAAAEAKRKIAMAASERATYERLRAKFEAGRDE